MLCYVLTDFVKKNYINKFLYNNFSTANRATPTVFEKSNCIGGTWVFNPQTGKDER